MVDRSIRVTSPTDVDDLLVGKLEDDFLGAGVLLEVDHFGVEVVAHVALLFLDVFDHVLVVVTRKRKAVFD